MGGNVLKKLRSRKGASITFALLAFLVCAAIGAVLLTAATASAGRISKLAESDQRYYAVRSAAQLFCDALDGQSYTIKRTKVYIHGKEITYITDPDTMIESKIVSNYTPVGSGESYEYTIKLPMDNPSGTYVSIDSVASKSLLTELALYYVFGRRGVYSDYDVVPGATDPNEKGDFQDWNMTITLSGDSVDTSGLKVNVRVEPMKNGSVKLTFTSVPNDYGDFYQMSVLLQAAVQDDSAYPTKTSETEVSIHSDSEHTNAYIELQKITDTEVKTTTITWTVAEIGR